jgi:hypothetical protein
LIFGSASGNDLAHAFMCGFLFNRGIIFLHLFYHPDFQNLSYSWWTTTIPHKPGGNMKDTIAFLIIIGVFLLIIWWILYAFQYHKNNVTELITRSGWKHELVKSGTVERRFSGSAHGIDWVMEFKIPESRRDSGQLALPSILEWRTSTVKLARGIVVIITIPPTGGDGMKYLPEDVHTDGENTDYTYSIMLNDLDIWLSDDLVHQQIGSIEFQGRYTVMADTRESAQQVLNAAENLLLQWPEWGRRDLLFIPAPVLIADTNGISVRISLHGLGLKSRVHKETEKKPFLKRVFAITRLGVEIAAGIRDMR